MSEHNPQEPQARPEDDDLSVEELEHVAGGGVPGQTLPDFPDDGNDTTNGNCVSCPNTNCPC